MCSDAGVCSAAYILIGSVGLVDAHTRLLTVHVCREIAMMDRQRRQADVKQKQALKGFLG
jgi:hypothetical protein